MEVPAYLKIIWQYKWLLLFGAAVAAVVGILVGFNVGPDGLTSKATRTYSARTTLLITSAQDTLYQAEIPAREIPEGYTAPQSIDLSNTAVIYAYLISGSNLQEDVFEVVGPFDPAVESISAVRRTTQPAGNERFPGNLRLPLIDVVAVSGTPERAELLAQTTTEVFLKHVTIEQDRRELKADERVVVEVTNVGRATIETASNAYTPVVFTAGGIFVGFVVLVFAIHGLRTTRAKKGGRRVGQRGAVGPDVADAGETTRAEASVPDTSDSDVTDGHGSSESATESGAAGFDPVREAPEDTEPSDADDADSEWMRPAGSREALVPRSARDAD